MIDTNMLRGLIASRGYSQSDIAKELGVTRDTFYRKMKLKVFNSNEMDILIKVLDIQDPIPVFFMGFY